MTLRPCSECGHNVSSTAKKCPSCGADTPLKRSTDAAGCIGLIVLIAVAWPILSLVSSCNSAFSSGSSKPAASPIATKPHSNRRVVEAKESVMMRRWRHTMNADLGGRLFVGSSVSDCSGDGTYCGTANFTLNGDEWDSLSPQSQNILFRKAILAYASAFKFAHRHLGDKSAGIWVNFRDLSGTTIKSCGLLGCSSD